MALAAPRPTAEDDLALLERVAELGIDPADPDNYVASLAAEQEAEGNAALATELRKQCETIIGFTEYRMQRYVADRHHRFVAEQLERVERREIDRLILEMPPRHGKLVSRESV